MADTIDSYIAGFPPDIEQVLERIRETIRDAAPDATEAIKYGMPTFRLGGAYVIYFAAWKKHIGMYPVAPGTAAFETAIAPYRAEKDTVQFRYKDPIPYELIARIVKARLKEIAKKLD